MVATVRGTFRLVPYSQCVVHSVAGFTVHLTHRSRYIPEHKLVRNEPDSSGHFPESYPVQLGATRKSGFRLPNVKKRISSNLESEHVRSCSVNKFPRVCV